MPRRHRGAMSELKYFGVWIFPFGKKKKKNHFSKESRHFFGENFSLIENPVFYGEEKRTSKSLGGKILPDIMEEEK